MRQIDKKLIVVADDFGWTEGINRAIVKAHTEGIVTEISLMLNAPGTDHALTLIKEHSFTNVGIHLGLIGWNKNRRFLNRADYIKLFKESSDAEIEQLTYEELGLFEKLLGHKPTHIIPQYGIHGNLKLLKPLMVYAEKHDIAMRIPQTALSGGAQPGGNFAAEIELKRSAIRTTDHLFAHVVGNDYDKVKQSFIKDLLTVKAGESTEILFHPGYFDEELLSLTSLTYDRARDLALICEEDFKNQIDKMGYKRIAYREL